MMVLELGSKKVLEPSSMLVLEVGSSLGLERHKVLEPSNMMKLVLESEPSNMVLVLEPVSSMVLVEGKQEPVLGSILVLEQPRSLGPEHSKELEPEPVHNKELVLVLEHSKELVLVLEHNKALVLEQHSMGSLLLLSEQLCVHGTLRTNRSLPFSERCTR